MRQLISVFLLCGAGFLSAQSQPPVAQIGNDQASLAFKEMELFRRTVTANKDGEARQVTAKRDEQIARAQFWEKATRFVALWGDFATRLNQNQTFDVKMAKKLSKAFHELETSQGWPVQPDAGEHRLGFVQPK